MYLQSLISEEHYASTDIESRLRGLEEEHGKLHDTWKKRQGLFSQCYELQVFLRDAEQRDGWLGTQEAFLANEDLGVSVRAGRWVVGDSAAGRFLSLGVWLETQVGWLRT